LIKIATLSLRGMRQRPTCCVWHVPHWRVMLAPVASPSPSCPRKLFFAQLRPTTSMPAAVPRRSAMGRACGPLECCRAGRPPYLASAGAADQGGAQGRGLGFAADGLVRPYRCAAAVGAMGQGLAGPVADDQEPALHAGACGQVQRSPSPSPRDGCARSIDWVRW
jgi:hypothetical protein